MKSLIKRMLICGLVAGIAIAFPAPAEAQRVPADTTLGAALEEVRRGHPRLQIARRLLTQEWGPESPEKLDALADSLVEIAIGYRPGDPLSDHNGAFAAIQALTGSGRPHSRVPYAGAFEALTRIHEGSEDVGHQGVALGAMTRLADTGGVLPYLREAAVRDRPSASAAVGALAGMGPEGVAALHELHHEDLVEHRSARFTLHLFAARQGWEPRVRLSDCKATIRKVDPETGELGEEQCLSGPPTAGGGG